MLWEQKIGSASWLDRELLAKGWFLPILHEAALQWIEGEVATVSEGSRDGRLTAMWFLKLFNCDMRIEAEVLKLIEGLHGQDQRSNVRLVLWWRKVGWEEKKRGEKGWWSVSQLDCLTGIYAITTNCRREGCRELVRYRGVRENLSMRQLSKSEVHCMVRTNMYPRMYRRSWNVTSWRLLKMWMICFIVLRSTLLFWINYDTRILPW